MLSGDKLKSLRIINHKTQKQIAEWCNVSIRYVGMVEHGEEFRKRQIFLRIF